VIKAEFTASLLQSSVS